MPAKVVRPGDPVNLTRAESSRVRARAKLFLGRDVADSTQSDPRAERPAGAAGGAARLLAAGATSF